VGISVRSVLDTSVLIAADVAPIPGELAVSVASLAELHFGVLAARDARAGAARLRRLLALEREFEPLPIDARVARAYGELAAVVATAGVAPRARTVDLLVAATALAHGAHLVTRNPDGLHGAEHLLHVVTV